MLKKDQKIAIYMEGYLGDEHGKMGYGVMRYGKNPVACVIDSRMAGMLVSDACDLPFDYPVVATVVEAKTLGAEVLLLGTAPSGGKVPSDWYPPMEQALAAGMSLVNGLHDPLSELLADKIIDPKSQYIWDTRKPGLTPEIADARAASLDNLRVLMIGTDMAIGKMTAGLEVHRALREKGVSSGFVATGQIGVTITGAGIPLDAFKVDHACGAVETAVMREADNDVIIIEGQGSLLHPGSSATLPLLRGSCANRLILCHRAGMTGLREPSPVKLPSLKEFIRLNEALAGVCGSLTAAQAVGIALNTSQLGEQEAQEEILRLESETGLPVEDVVRNGADKLADALLASKV